MQWKDIFPDSRGGLQFTAVRNTIGHAVYGTSFVRGTVEVDKKASESIYRMLYDFSEEVAVLRRNYCSAVKADQEREKEAANAKV